MKKEKIHTNFNKAVEFINNFQEPIPPDLLLKLYAYYKIGNENHSNPGSKTPLINAFKANALLQVQNISIDKARKEYYKLVKKEFNDFTG